MLGWQTLPERWLVAVLVSAVHPKFWRLHGSTPLSSSSTAPGAPQEVPSWTAHEPMLFAGSPVSEHLLL